MISTIVQCRSTLIVVQLHVVIMICVVYRLSFLMLVLIRTHLPMRILTSSVTFLPEESVDKILVFLGFLWFLATTAFRSSYYGCYSISALLAYASRFWHKRAGARIPVAYATSRFTRMCQRG